MERGFLSRSLAAFWPYAGSSTCSYGPHTGLGGGRVHLLHAKPWGGTSRHPWDGNASLRNSLSSREHSPKLQIKEEIRKVIKEIEMEG